LVVTTLEERFQALVEAAAADPDVVGVAMTGSRGKGFPTATSDYDVMVVFRDGAPAERRQWYEGWREEEIDLWTLSMGELARHTASWGREFAWNIVWWERYDYADATVLVDKTGTLRGQLAQKGAVPEELKVPLLRESLDAYVNSFYRSLKCLRNGNRLGARLEAGDSIGFLLTFVYALDGRHRPFFGYLERELRARPLKSLPLSGKELLAMIGEIVESGNAAPQQALFEVIDAVAWQHGCGDVLEAWGDDYPWMRSYRPEGAGERD
jgi:hypothetical protein